ncbi:MAG: hypothetical protein JWR19_843 [Pedosphaera sp.]|nr:hypothetical protein [Pedosphaera sp.]
MQGRLSIQHERRKWTRRGCEREGKNVTVIQGKISKLADLDRLFAACLTSIGQGMKVSYWVTPLMKTGS